MVTKKTRRPYVGVSGVAHFYQAAAVRNLAHAVDLHQTHDVVLGIKATHKTLMLGVENKYGADWYAVGQAIGDAPIGVYGLSTRWLRPVAQVFLETPENAEYRNEFTRRLKRACSPGLTGIQYDLLPWHEPDLDPGLIDYLARVRDTGYDVYLQVHGPAMALGPTEAAKAFAPYAKHVDHLLFDSSHGTGTAMDVARLTEFIDAFSGFGISMGVAGGLGADLPLLELVATHPEISWDAESRLHPTRPDGSRRLDLGLTEDYLRASARLVQYANRTDSERITR